MINFKKFLILVVLLTLILTLTPTLLLAQDSNEIPFDRLKAPTELQDIIDTFGILEYNFIAFEDGEKAQELLIEFQYQGKEDVNDGQADKIFIETSTMETSQPSQMTLWLDDGEIVKMVQNEQEIPGAMAESMKDKMLRSIFFPFYSFEKLDLEEIASAGKVTRSQEMIGEKEVDIIEIKGNNLAEYGLKSGDVKLIDFGEIITVASFDYEYLEEVEAEYEKGQFEIKEIELR